MMLSVAALVLVGAAVLFAFGNALGAKGRHQWRADLAAISAAQVMLELYPHLFEPPFIEPDVPNPRHLEDAEYRAPGGSRGREGRAAERGAPARERLEPSADRLRADQRNGAGPRRGAACA